MDQIKREDGKPSFFFTERSERMKIVTGILIACGSIMVIAGALFREWSGWVDDVCHWEREE